MAKPAAFESFRPDQQASRNINTGNTWEPGHASGRALLFLRCPVTPKGWRLRVVMVQRLPITRVLMGRRAHLDPKNRKSHLNSYAGKAREKTEVARLKEQESL